MSYTCSICHIRFVIFITGICQHIAQELQGWFFFFFSFFFFLSCFVLYNSVKPSTKLARLYLVSVGCCCFKKKKKEIEINACLFNNRAKEKRTRLQTAGEAFNLKSNQSISCLASRAELIAIYQQRGGDLKAALLSFVIYTFTKSFLTLLHSDSESLCNEAHFWLLRLVACCLIYLIKFQIY